MKIEQVANPAEEEVWRDCQGDFLLEEGDSYGVKEKGAGLVLVYLVQGEWTLKYSVWTEEIRCQITGIEEMLIEPRCRHVAGIT